MINQEYEQRKGSHGERMEVEMKYHQMEVEMKYHQMEVEMKYHQMEVEMKYHQIELPVIRESKLLVDLKCEKTIYRLPCRVYVVLSCISPEMIFLAKYFLPFLEMEKVFMNILIFFII